MATYRNESHTDKKDKEYVVLFDTPKVSKVEQLGIALTELHTYTAQYATETNTENRWKIKDQLFQLGKYLVTLMKAELAQENPELMNEVIITLAKHPDPQVREFFVATWVPEFIKVCKESIYAAIIKLATDPDKSVRIAHAIQLAQDLALNDPAFWAAVNKKQYLANPSDGSCYREMSDFQIHNTKLCMAKSPAANTTAQSSEQTSTQTQNNLSRKELLGAVELFDDKNSG